MDYIKSENPKSRGLKFFIKNALVKRREDGI
jgi:hypothetical protein